MRALFVDVLGNAVRISASQISTWMGCRRAWAYSRLRPRVQSQWQAFGDRVHKILENWLQFGKVPCIVPPNDTLEDHTAFAGLHLIPMPPQAGVEYSFEYVFDGVTYIGRIDLLSLYVPRVRVLVTDHKSTGDLQWVKAPDELRNDPQWITYGFTGAELLDVETVGGQWVYYQRATNSREAKARDVTIVQTREQVRVAFVEQHRRVVLPMAQSRAAMPADPVLREIWISTHDRCANPGSKSSYCSKYRGCPYRDECLGQLTPLERGMAALAA